MSFSALRLHPTVVRMSWLTPWTLFEFTFPQWYTNKTSSFDISPRRGFKSGSSLTQVFTWLLRQAVSFPYSLLQRWIGRCVSILGPGGALKGGLGRGVPVFRRPRPSNPDLINVFQMRLVFHTHVYMIAESKAYSLISIFAKTKVNRMLRQYLRPGGTLTGTLGRGKALKTWPYLRKKNAHFATLFQTKLFYQPESHYFAYKIKRE